MVVSEWQREVPQTPGYFERRIKFFNVRLPNIRVIRWKGNLVWNLASETKGFRHVHEFDWRTRFIEFRRYNGVHLL